MGTIKGGYYFNVMHLTFNKKRESNLQSHSDDDGLFFRHRLMEIDIEGPVPVCDKVFENTGRCNELPPSQLAKAGKLVNWHFHNQKVYPHPAINAIYEEKWMPKMKPYF